MSTEHLSNAQAAPVSTLAESLNCDLYGLDAKLQGALALIGQHADAESDDGLIAARYLLREAREQLEASISRLDVASLPAATLN